MALLHTSTIPLSIHPSASQLLLSPAKISIFSFTTPILRLPSLILHPRNQFRATSTYVYPDPIPEFAQSETLKFRAELLKELSLEKEAFGDDLVRVVDLCAEHKKQLLQFWLNQVMPSNSSFSYRYSLQNSGMESWISVYVPF